MTKIANSPLEKSNEEHYDNLKVAKAWIKSLMDKIEFETTPVKTRWERKYSGSTPVEKRRKLDKLKRYWKDDTTLRLDMEGI